MPSVRNTTLAVARFVLHAALQSAPQWAALCAQLAEPTLWLKHLPKLVHRNLQLKLKSLSPSKRRLSLLRKNLDRRSQHRRKSKKRNLLHKRL